MMRKVCLLCVTLVVIFHSSDAGVSFVRWGRKVCPDNTHLLYKGYMSGKWHGSSGSGSNYLCVHEEPSFVRARAGRQGVSGLIFGVEFDIIDAYNGLFNSENVPGGQLVQQDMPCAVCYVEGSQDQLMLPGRQDCAKTGYDFQYKGFLVSSAHGQAGNTNYVCLDDSPEGIVGGSGNNDNAVIYPVELGCGSLPCNPFVEGYEMPCAVCTY